MEGIVLAGVHSWGDCVLEQVTCWPLLPVAGRPLITHTLRWFRHWGIHCARVCANSDTTSLIERLGDGRSLGIALQYYEDVMPRGPAGIARDAMLGSRANVFVVVDGSVIPDTDMHHLLRTHETSGALLTVATGPPHRLNGNGDAACEPLGIYVFSRELAEHIPALGYQDIKEALIPQLYAEGLAVATCPIRANSMPRVRSAVSYLAANKCMADKLSREGLPSDVYRRVSESQIHRSSRVDPSAQLIGPVLIEPGCVVGSGAVIVGPTTVGEGCSIGRGAIISRTAIWRRCRIGAEAIVDDSILADGVEIERGVLVRNAVRISDSVNASPFASELSPCLGWDRRLSRRSTKVSRGERKMEQPQLSDVRESGEQQSAEGMDAARSRRGILSGG